MLLSSEFRVTCQAEEAISYNRYFDKVNQQSYISKSSQTAVRFKAENVGTFCSSERAKNNSPSQCWKGVDFHIWKGK